MSGAEQKASENDQAALSAVAQQGDPAAVTIARQMGAEEVMVVSIEVGGVLVKVEMSLHDFALAVTGRGEAPAIVSKFVVRGDGSPSSTPGGA